MSIPFSHTELPAGTEWYVLSFMGQWDSVSESICEQFQTYSNIRIL